MNISLQLICSLVLVAAAVVFAFTAVEDRREHVRQKFLLTRHLADYLLTFLTLFHEGDTIRLNGSH